MNFPKNNYRISEEEVNAVLESIARQIAAPKSNETFGVDVVARVHGWAYYHTWDKSKRITYFNKDAIWQAIPVIKENGWHVWAYTDYQDELSIWITASSVCPHPWYRKL